MSESGPNYGTPPKSLQFKSLEDSDIEVRLQLRKDEQGSETRRELSIQVPMVFPCHVAILLDHLCGDQFPASLVG